MSTKTSNYNLTKPDYSENASIGDLNNNFDILDTELFKKANKPSSIVAGNILTMDAGGNPCDSEKKPSDFGDMLKSVYDTDNDGIVDNTEKLNGLTASATPTTTEKADIVSMINELVTALTNKASISSKINFTLLNGWSKSYGNLEITKIGSLCYVNFQGVVGTASDGTTVFNITDATYRPIYQQIAYIPQRNAGVVYAVCINTNGNVNLSTITTLPTAGNSTDFYMIWRVD